MSEQKLALLAAIAALEPSSIYQLARLVGRDFANVQRDCTALDAMGFIKLEETGNAKRAKAPRLAFGYRRIVVEMPQLTYSHDLGLAA